MEVNIDELLFYYIEVNFLDNQKKDLYTSLSILHNFGMKYYDSEIVSHLMNDDLYDTNTLKDIVYNKIKEKISLIIKEHLIVLDYEQNITLEELNEIANFLYLIQNIENYEDASYIISGDTFEENSNKTKLVNLIAYFSTLDKIRLENIILEVNDVFIKGLESYINDRIEKLKDVVDMNYLNNFNYFLKFIDNQECIGKILFEKNFKNLTLDELLNLANIDFHLIEEKIAISNIALFSLHVLSILFLAKDTYENPLLGFSKNSHIFLQDKSKIYVVSEILRKMIIDFNDYAKALKSGYNIIEEKQNEEN